VYIYNSHTNGAYKYSPYTGTMILCKGDTAIKIYNYLSCIMYSPNKLIINFINERYKISVTKNDFKTIRKIRTIQNDRSAKKKTTISQIFFRKCKIMKQPFIFLPIGFNRLYRISYFYRKPVATIFK
jgi:hypothetical protein